MKTSKTTNALITIALFVITILFLSFKYYGFIDFSHIDSSIFAAIGYLLPLYAISAGLAAIIRRKTEPFSWFKVNKFAIIFFAILVLVEVLGKK